VEPFAGAAGYSLRYPDRKVVLVEKNPVVAELWRWLIAATPQEILGIPLVDSVEELPSNVSVNARTLVGFTLNDGVASPRKILSAGLKRSRETGRHYAGWTAARRSRTATSISAIKHWKIIEGDYSLSPDLEATWFVDPPYYQAGRHYPYFLPPEAYGPLGAWCKERRGQILVCEAEGAQWLPFSSFRTIRSGPIRQRHEEVLWIHETLEPEGEALEWFLEER
jgi:hypothetical protein